MPVISVAACELQDLAWAARGFGQAKALAVAARARGEVSLARFFAKEARDEWRRLSNYLRSQGALP